MNDAVVEAVPSSKDLVSVADCGEPCNGIEFESNEAAYAFYQDYAKSMGFTTSIKNSRRSKKSKEFIDAKFACSRYGVTHESDGSTRRPTVKKTNCKASMHVKRRKDGKWYIHEFLKDHNHELLPALAYHFRIQRNVKLAEKNNIDILHAVSERTRKMYVDMSRQSGTSFLIASPDDPSFDSHLDRGRFLVLEEGDAQVMLEYFMHIQRENPSFFYAIDLNEDQRLRNLFWVDAKSRKDYNSFNDVVFFDTSYLKTTEKMPFAPFVGVNHHLQPMLLGCGLLGDETVSTFLWLMKTWSKAMGGQAPKVIITDQDKALKAAVAQVFPNSRHCYALWHILEKLPVVLAHVVKQHDCFVRKFNKCIFKSLTDDDFDLRWWKMVGRFELHENEWIRSLYEDRKKWVPTFMQDTFLAGMSTTQRSESVSSFFDKYIYKRISLREFVRQYGTILQNRYEEEAIADFDTWHKQPALKSPSPWEKQMSTIYTHAIFRKFQIEVLGVVGCHPKKETQDESVMTFRVDDCEKGENFMVTWNEATSEVSCSCLMFEYKGYLCRHAMIVLQMQGLSSIPFQYILRRWTKDSKNKQPVADGTEGVLTRVQRYNDLCKRATELGEEGSLSEENYSVAYQALVDGLKNCVDINNKSGTEGSSNHDVLRALEVEKEGANVTKESRKKSTNKRRKVQSESEGGTVVEVQSSLLPMENLGSDGITLNGHYGSQQNVQGLIQLNLMELPHDAHYVNEVDMPGLGQLNSSASSHDGFFASQQNVAGLVGHLEFRPPSFTYTFQEDPNMRVSQLPGGTARRG